MSSTLSTFDEFFVREQPSTKSLRVIEVHRSGQEIATFRQRRHTQVSSKGGVDLEGASQPISSGSIQFKKISVKSSSGSFEKGEDGEDESGGGDWGRGELVVAIFKIC